MNSEGKTQHRKVTAVVLTLSIGVFFALSFLAGGRIISAQSSLEQNADPDQVLSVATETLYRVTSSLDFTPVMTAYLPLIRKPPSPTTGCGPTNGSGGLAPGRYKTTVAGLNATIVVGEGYDPQTPTYLSFYIHGDYGSWTKFYSNPSNPVTQFVNQQSWIFVAPQSPNDGDSWWDNWNGDHNEAFAGVLEEMLAKYNVCQNTVFGSSGSGGSEFWTRYFFPEKGDQHPAHTVIGCGGNDGLGSAGNQKIIVLGQNADTVNRSTFEYVYGTEDSLAGRILESIDIYTQAGFNVIVHELAGAGHCNEWADQGLPNLSERIALHWEARAKALGVYRDQ